MNNLRETAACALQKDPTPSINKVGVTEIYLYAHSRDDIPVFPKGQQYIYTTNILRCHA